jgi:hypothetical protein
MAGSQLSSEAECPLDWTWLDNAWEDLIYEDLAYEDETQYGKETEESRPGHNLREQPLSFRSRCLLLLVVVLIKPQ